MSLTDALIVTALGLAVVFAGLILTALLIGAFGLVSRLEEKPEAESSPASPVVAPAPRGPVNEAIFAVIATTLEVERRLHHAEIAGRLTIVRASEARRVE